MLNLFGFVFIYSDYSPAISLHWTYYYIKLGGTANFSLKGIGPRRFQRQIQMPRKIINKNAEVFSSLLVS